MSEDNTCGAPPSRADEETDNALDIPLWLSRRIGAAALEGDELANEIVYCNLIFEKYGNEDEKSRGLELARKWCVEHAITGVSI